MNLNETETNLLNFIRERQGIYPRGGVYIKTIKRYFQSFATMHLDKLVNMNMLKEVQRSLTNKIYRTTLYYERYLQREPIEEQLYNLKGTLIFIDTFGRQRHLLDGNCVDLSLIADYLHGNEFNFTYSIGSDCIELLRQNVSEQRIRQIKDEGWQLVIIDKYGLVWKSYTKDNTPLRRFNYVP